ncbi:hypothetical protein PMAYCL1PPCAC_03879 [Pristionchus mayeri]|uniref:Uncharacterized protein n=1 Tax=Pristionchus mayeri TaxID=1317129 RepID=A0AAN4Z5G5_9BILA|nr:hypothetical protein PMAYCL1PPCAC_03879 [Pristionchus mayeri]
MFDSVKPIFLHDLLTKLLCILCDISQARCNIIFTTAQKHGIFERVVYIILQTTEMTIDKNKPSAYSAKILDLLNNSVDMFYAAFKTMATYRCSSVIRYMYLALLFSRNLRNKIREDEVILLLHGHTNQQGVLAHSIQTNRHYDMFYTLHINKTLTTRNTEAPLERYLIMQNWFVKHNVFSLLLQCLDLKNDCSLAEHALDVFGNIVGLRLSSSKFSTYSMNIPDKISDEVAVDIARIISSERFTNHNVIDFESALIRSLCNLSSERFAVQKLLITSHAFNYACDLITAHAEMAHFETSYTTSSAQFLQPTGEVPPRTDGIQTNMV